MKGVALVLSLAFIMAFAVRPAAAHSDLVAAEPEPGAQLAESPAEIRLTFSEPVAPTSQIALLTDTFQPVEGLVGQYDTAHPDQVYTPLPELAPGIYTVQWVAASADGHEISGSYSFSVGMVTPGAASGDSSNGETGQPAEAGSSGASWWIVALVVLAVGLPVGMVVLRRFGRR